MFLNITFENIKLIWRVIKNKVKIFQSTITISVLWRWQSSVYRTSLSLCPLPGIDHC